NSIIFPKPVKASLGKDGQMPPGCPMCPMGGVAKVGSRSRPSPKLAYARERGMGGLLRPFSQFSRFRLSRTWQLRSPARLAYAHDPTETDHVGRPGLRQDRVGAIFGHPSLPTASSTANCTGSH